MALNPFEQPDKTGRETVHLDFRSLQQEAKIASARQIADACQFDWFIQIGNAFFRAEYAKKAFGLYARQS